MDYNLVTASHVRIVIEESLMPNDVSYNQLISMRGSSIKCHALLGSQVFEGKLILIIGNNKKLQLMAKILR